MIVWRYHTLTTLALGTSVASLDTDLASTGTGFVEIPIESSPSLVLLTDVFSLPACRDEGLSIPDPSSALDPFAPDPKRTGFVEVGRGGGAVLLPVDGVLGLNALGEGAVDEACSCSNLLLSELTGANSS
jgi:hypothetical protein